MDKDFLRHSVIECLRNIDPAELDDLLPWSEKLPDECRKPRR